METPVQQPVYQKQQQKPQIQVLEEKELFVLNYGKWEGPGMYQVNVENFHNMPLTSISKLKIRRRYEPYSK